MNVSVEILLQRLSFLLPCLRICLKPLLRLVLLYYLTLRKRLVVFLLFKYFLLKLSNRIGMVLDSLGMDGVGCIKLHKLDYFGDIAKSISREVA
jgi:hypothetical protein